MTTSTDTSEPIIAVDLFSGAGGFSEGLRQACEEIDTELRLASINHDRKAVESHEANHPDAVQFHSKVEQLHPPDIVDDLADGSVSDVHTDDVTVDLLTAGPECTHFSTARGGKPVSEQKRVGAWEVLRWIQQLDVSAFVIENVPEIKSWGPVEDGQPTRNGEVFDAWTDAMNSLGYAVVWDTLKASEFGDPTSRERFFLIGHQTAQPTFPSPTHSDGNDKLPDCRTAAEIIDWSDPGTSIWTRDITEKRIHTPPKDTTMKRIAEGVRRHCSDRLEPFADALEDLGREKIKTLRQERVVPAAHADLVASATDEPFLVCSTPSQQVTRHDSILLRQQDGGPPWNINNRPSPTIPTGGGHSIATPVTSLIEPKNGPHRGIHSNPLYHPNDQPFHTVTTDPRAKLVSPSLIRYSHGGAALDPTDPMPTIATERGGVFALSDPYLCPLYNERTTQAPRTRGIDRPLMTVPSSKSPAGLTAPIIKPFIDDYEGPAAPVSEPLRTVTSIDRFALCVPELWPWGLDIRYRMLQPSELKQAQGFPRDYELVGNKRERTKQIGNAVPVSLAKNLCKHVLTAGSPSLATYGGGITAESGNSIPEYQEVSGSDD